MTNNIILQCTYLCLFKPYFCDNRCSFTAIMRFIRGIGHQQFPCHPIPRIIRTSLLLNDNLKILVLLYFNQYYYTTQMELLNASLALFVYLNTSSGMASWLFSKDILFCIVLTPASNYPSPPNQPQSLSYNSVCLSIWTN